MLYCVYSMCLSVYSPPENLSKPVLSLYHAGPRFWWLSSLYRWVSSPVCSWHFLLPIFQVPEFLHPLSVSIALESKHWDFLYHRCSPSFFFQTFCFAFSYLPPRMSKRRKEKYKNSHRQYAELGTMGGCTLLTLLQALCLLKGRDKQNPPGAHARGLVQSVLIPMTSHVLNPCFLNYLNFARRRSSCSLPHLTPTDMLKVHEFISLG